MAPTRLLKNHCWKQESTAQPLWCIDMTCSFPWFPPKRKPKDHKTTWVAPLARCSIFIVEVKESICQDSMWQRVNASKWGRKKDLLLYLLLAELCSDWGLNFKLSWWKSRTILQHMVWYGYLVRSHRYIGDADRGSASLNFEYGNKNWMGDISYFGPVYNTHKTRDVANSPIIMKSIRQGRERKGRFVHQII